VRNTIVSCWLGAAVALLLGGCDTAPTDDAMGAECRAKAAVQYGMPEAAMNVESPIGRDGGGGFALPGSVDKGAEGTKTFLCRYSAARTLIDVMATTPDGE
jgi:hypothetical protein